MRFAYSRITSIMSKIKLSLAEAGVFHVLSLSSEAAAKANELLQENHDNHHIFFNESGFHSTFLSRLQSAYVTTRISDGKYHSDNGHDQIISLIISSPSTP